MLPILDPVLVAAGLSSYCTSRRGFLEKNTGIHFISYFNMRSNLVFCVFVLIPLIGATNNIDPPFPCNQDADCKSLKFVNAKCEEGRCICPDKDNENNFCKNLNITLNYHPTPTVTLIGRICQNNIDCSGSNTFCNTTTKQCFCVKDFIASTDLKKCLEKLHSYESPCVDDKQCLAILPNSVCRKEKCECSKDFHLLNKTCWKNIGFGEVCTQSEECEFVENAECTLNNNNNNNTKICGCKENTIISKNGKRCLPVAQKYLDECVEDMQCSFVLNNTLCIDKQCKCVNESMHFQSDLRGCIPSSAIEDTCINDADCYQKEDPEGQRGLSCIANTCECAVNFNREGDICVPQNNGSNFVEISFITVLLVFLISIIL